MFKMFFKCSRLQIALWHTEIIPERESGLFSTNIPLVSLLINVRKDMFGYFKLEWNLQMLGVCVHVIHCIHHGNEDGITKTTDVPVQRKSFQLPGTPIWTAKRTRKFSTGQYVCSQLLTFPRDYGVIVSG